MFSAAPPNRVMLWVRQHLGEATAVLTAGSALLIWERSLWIRGWKRESVPNPASSQNFKRRPGSFVLCVGGLSFLDEVLHAASPQLPVFSHRPTSLKSQSDPGPSSRAHCGRHCLLGPGEKVMGMRTT